MLGVLAVAGCFEAKPPSLSDEARAAMLETLDNPVSARFDAAGEVAVDELALLCGSRMTYADRHGARVETRAFLYRRGRGIALEGRDVALFEELKQECERATRR